MRFLSPLLIAGALSLASLSVVRAADASTAATSAPPVEVVPEAPSDTPPPAQPAAATRSATPATAAEVASPPPEPSTETAPVSESTPAEAATPSEDEEAPAAAPTPVAVAPVSVPQVVTARIDPELALRLSLLEKTMLAQTNGQNAIYTETTRLLMFFGTACVAMGLVAMIAAVFLMNRTLASVSAITAQVAQAQAAHVPQALPAAGSLIPAGATPATGFEKVQASGQRFQTRMTSLEQRLEELEHLAGQAPASPTVAGTAAEPAVGEPRPEPAIEAAPRRIIPRAAILVRKAETLMNLGKLNESIATLDEAALHEGDPSEVHLARGRVLEKLGRLGDALESYDLAATTNEGNTAALLMKAGVLNRQERFDEALSCYERALAVHRASN